MKAATAVKGISRIVVLLHPGQLQNGIVLSLAQTDFDVSDEQLDEWKRRFIEGGGACIYDGPPANAPVSGGIPSAPVDCCQDSGCKYTK